MSLAIDVSDMEPSAIAARDSASAAALRVFDLQMYSDTPAAKVANTEHATNHVSPQIVEDEDLPYWLAICIQHGSRLWYYAVGRGGIVGKVGGICGGVIKVEYALNRS